MENADFYSKSYNPDENTVTVYISMSSGKIPAGYDSGAEILKVLENGNFFNPKVNAIKVWEF